jgi:hypothetical protein
LKRHLFIILASLFFTVSLCFAASVENTPPAASSGETSNDPQYSFNVPEDNNKKLIISGNLDSRFEIQSGRASSPLYNIKFYNTDKKADYYTYFQGDLNLNLDFVHNKVEFHLKTRTTYINPSQAEFNFLEGFGRVNFSNKVMFEMGAIRFNWGKGYAFNPAGFANPTKNPEDLNEQYSGKASAHLQFQTSVNTKALTSFALNAVVLPVFEEINEKYGRLKKMSYAGKVYFLLFGIDIDLMAYGTKGEPFKLGMDFSKDIGGGIAVHGEASYYFNSKYYIINSSLLLEEKEKNTYSLLIGAKIKFVTDTSITLEYYYNRAGMKPSDYRNYHDLAQASYQSYVSSSDDSMINTFNSYTSSYFGSKNLGRNYVYFQIQQSDMFNLTYFNPYVSLIFNLDDRSMMIIPTLSYAPYQNMEFILYTMIAAGRAKTEYGDKKDNIKYGFRFKVFF